MAIAKKPGARPAAPPPSEADQRADAFISGAGHPPTAPPAAPPAPGRGKKARVMIQVAEDILQRVDATAQKRGLSRSAWIAFVISQALEDNKG